MPLFPFRVGLISAPQSRAHTDFEHQLVSSGVFPGTLIFIPCSMQGEKVPKEVVAAIKNILEADVDVIVISRGGGSAADLRWFDGEEIAVAIANASVPVICAIGHHDDQSIAEEVCHTRQKTPTAAADAILEIFRATRSQINEAAHWLAMSLDREMKKFSLSLSNLETKHLEAYSRFFDREREKLNSYTNAIGHTFEVVLERQYGQFDTYLSRINSAFDQQSLRKIQSLDFLANDLSTSSLNSIRNAQDRLTLAENNLARLDPKPWLNKGWTQLFVEGKHLTSVTEVNKGSKVKARIKDGSLEMTIDQIQSK